MSRLGAIAAAALGAMLPRGFQGLSYYPAGVRARKRSVGSIAKRNRWTGKPHENKRAMARLAKQTARKESSA